jgi:SAM-dependent methyltransferase
VKELDSLDREKKIRSRIKGKVALYKLYREFYLRFADCIDRCEGTGIVIEIGSGAGFIKDVLPDVIASDILPYNTADIVFDAEHMPFSDGSIKSVFMLNTLHHIPDAESFFYELERCLEPGGRGFFIDQYSGWFSNLIYRFIHHEPYDRNTTYWRFETTGPLSGANGALCWIVFYRDKKRFNQLYPALKIIKIEPHTSLRYWFAGGLKWWSLLPGVLFDLFSRIDHWMARRFPTCSSFVNVEIVKDKKPM